MISYRCPGQTGSTENMVFKVLSQDDGFSILYNISNRMLCPPHPIIQIHFRLEHYTVRRFNSKPYRRRQILSFYQIMPALYLNVIYRRFILKRIQSLPSNYEIIKPMSIFQTMNSVRLNNLCLNYERVYTIWLQRYSDNKI